jgi:hypothetical protein
MSLLKTLLLKPLSALPPTSAGSQRHEESGRLKRRSVLRSSDYDIFDIIGVTDGLLMGSRPVLGQNLSILDFLGRVKL